MSESGMDPTAVHPRTRGEHRPKAARIGSTHGSSPHTRGTLQAGHVRPGRQRFIPAHAGNTASRSAERDLRAVHPRTRGEHLPRSDAVRCGHGSSPHTRGTLLGIKYIVYYARFIPAHAGNTNQAQPSSSTSSVHPRTRGEHRVSSPPARVSAGSSPHTRGTQTLLRLILQHRRFIPAHAGNTDSSHLRGAHKSVHPRTRGEHTYRKPLIQKQKSGPKKSTDLPPDKSSRQRPTARNQQSTQPDPQSPPPPARGYRSQSRGTAC